MTKRPHSTSAPRALRGELAAATGGGTPLPAINIDPILIDPAIIIGGTPLPAGPLRGTPLPAGPFYP